MLTIVGIVAVLVFLFSIARVMLGYGGALITTAVVGGCFGGVPGFGAGIVLGLVLAPFTAVLETALPSD